jgi:uncharacterized membrane protein YkoI
MKKHSFFLTLLVCATTFSTAVAYAKDSQSTAKKLQESGQILPLEKIAESAQTIKPGKILEIEFEENGGRYAYEVEIVDKQGQVWELDMDAKTGKLIELEKED